MSKNIVYSASIATGRNPSYPGKPDSWVAWGTHGLSEYAKRIGAEFRMITNANRQVTELLQLIATIKSNKAVPLLAYHRGAIVASYSTMYALQDFIESDYDKFFWLDLDIAFQHFDTDIFASWEPGLCIRQIPKAVSVMEEGTHHHKKFIGLASCGERYNFTPFPKYTLCGGNILSCDRENAEKILKVFYSFDIMTVAYWEFITETFEKGGRVSDETIFEIAINHLCPDLNLQELHPFEPPFSLIEAITFCSIEDGNCMIDYDKLRDIDFFMAHFRGDFKDCLPVFYKNVSKTGLQLP